eukprot:240895-Prymnesium_polylepis.1
MFCYGRRGLTNACVWSSNGQGGRLTYNRTFRPGPPAPGDRRKLPRATPRRPAPQRRRHAHCRGLSD